MSFEIKIKKSNEDNGSVVAASYPPDFAVTVRTQLAAVHRRPPSLSVLQRILETLYFASLKTEEGTSIQCRLTFANPAGPDPDPPERVRAFRTQFTNFAERAPLSVETITKLSKAFDPWSASIAVFSDAEGPYIWGIADQTLHTNTLFVSEGSGAITPPGQFHVVIDGMAQLSVFYEDTLLASLRHERIVARRLDVFNEGPLARVFRKYSAPLRLAVAESLRSNPDIWFPAAHTDSQDNAAIDASWIETLRRIIIGMQRYRHGGAILFHDGGSYADLSIKYGMQYDRLPQALAELHRHLVLERVAYDDVIERLDQDADEIPAEAYLTESVSSAEVEDQRKAVTGAVRLISSLCRVDGLVLISPQLSVQGFGVEIKTPDTLAAIYMTTAEKPDLGKLRLINASHYGTRHRSMMRYCNAHPKCVGIVISQDGDVRIIKKHRGKLIIWDNIKLLDYREPARRSTRTAATLPQRN